MRLVFLGAPGVGKGTQAEMVSAKYGIPKISTGDLLRAAVAQKTPLGLEAKQFMDRGDLVPDKVVIGLVEEKTNAAECAKGFILDGFPRTVPQADTLTGMLAKKGVSLDRVVYFVIPREEVISRLSGRRSCSNCPAVYHVEFVPPKQEGVCDDCGGTLIQRSDDQKETVESRLNVYEEQTSPLIQYYREKNLLVELNGSGAVEDVQGRLVALLSAS
ncbi:adenylate kinase [Candidatus Nitronereus thalassa]|uniref:Adenylate kinase n=1 Tax=Candidatus Nitronereus thalassa TaxID=3020898 RepID=A0ABU3KBM5_9BACT|nr:adenylate kinase [Candidatus Nitronereus thalassa]MDT7043836.1 adenylate kinase [Candidatus Nitronereus thalassa]